MASTSAPAPPGRTSSTRRRVPTPAAAGGGEPRRSAAQRVARRASGARAVRPSEPEEETSDLLDDLRVARRRPAGEAPEDRQHEVRRCVAEDRVAALEVALLRH